MKCPSRLARFMSAMVLVGGMGAPALAQDSPLGIPDPAPISIPAGSVLDTMIRAKLHLRQYSVADLTVQQLADGQVRIPVSLGGEAVTLALAPHSLRGDHFQVVTIGADGNQVAVEAPPASTFKGVAGGLEGSRVRASVRDGQVTALVILPDGGIWGIQPATAADPEAPAGLHIIFRDSDAEPMNRVCGVLPDAHDHSDEPQVGGDEGGALRGTGIKIADIALDADFEFYGLNGSSVPNTVNDMENVLNNVEGIYETAVQITFEITTVVVRTAEPDPYTTTNPGALLGQFQSWWNTNQALVRRDYAHLFTGKNIDGGVIGIASLGVVCNTSNAYGLAQSRFSLNMISRTCLSAHEMGHNWSAQHCDGPTTCAIMCSVLGGCPGGCQDFSTPERTQINNHRNSRTCLLDLRDPVTPAFNDQILSIDPVRWSFNFGALASSLSVNPPTPPLALQLNSSSANPNGNDDLRTNYIHMAGMGTGQLRYHVQHRGVEAGETLTVEVWTSQVRWQVVNTITSDGIDQTSFTEHVHPLTGTMLHDEFRVRFRASVDESNDTWYVDNVYVGEPIETPLPLPFSDQFPITTPDTTRWGTFLGLINTLGTAEPSAPNSVELDGTTTSHDEIKSRPIDLSGVPQARLSFYAQAAGPEAGEALEIEYLDTAMTWQPLASVIAPGGNQTTYTQATHVLPAGAMHGQFRVRFRSMVNAADDNFFVDDVRVEQIGCPADIDGNGLVTSADISAFLTIWFSDLANATLTADFDDNNTVNSADISSFLAAWFNALSGGC